MDDILSLFQESNEKEDNDNYIDENISNINKPKIFNYHINNENAKINNDNSNYDNNNKSFNNISNCKYLNDNNQNLKKKFSEISPIKIILGEEKRTTILIKNIPNLYKPKELFNEFMKNEDISGKFNYFYLLYNKKIHRNYGFAVINFINPFHIIIFFETYQKNKLFKYINEEHLELIFLNYNILNNKKYNINNLEILIPL